MKMETQTVDTTKASDGNGKLELARPGEEVKGDTFNPEHFTNPASLKNKRTLKDYI